MARVVALLITLAGFWAALSFQLKTPLLVGFGVVCVVAVTAVCAKHRILIEDWSPARLVAAIRYLPWLLWQIVIANLRVIKIIWSPSLPIDPRLVEVPCDLKTATGRMIYANSITLTPGTVTIDVGPHYLVHALTPEDEVGLLDGSMQARVRGLEGDAGASSPAPAEKDAS